MNTNPRTIFTNEELKKKREDLLRIADALQEMIDTPDLSMSECFRTAGLKYITTRRLLDTLGRVDVSVPRGRGNERPTVEKASPEELLYRVVFGANEIRLPDDYKETVRYVMDTELNSRERTVILGRLGFHGIIQTLQELGDEFKVTKEGIRKIESKALRKMRANPTRTLLQLGLIDYQKRLKIAEKQKEEKKSLNRWKNVSRMEEPEIIQSFLFDKEYYIHVSEEDLSSRATNALRRAFCFTLFDLYSMTAKEIYSVRNLGVSSIREIGDTLNKIAAEHGTTTLEIHQLCRNLVDKHELTLQYPGRAEQLKQQLEEQKKRLAIL